jgi:beta-phosphoglucomutase
MTNTEILRAALWDMDGTLIDSGEYHWLSWQGVLAAEGRPITRDEFAATFGQRNDTILRGWFSADLPDAEVMRISNVKEARYRDLMREHGIELLPGVRHWIERLHDEGWRQAVASSAPLENIRTILAVMEIESFFDTLVSAEHVQRGKPDPQVFLLAAEGVGVPPARCVVVEDAPAGLEAGQRAGMRTIGVRSSHRNLHADIVVDTLDQLPDDAFERLTEPQRTQRPQR